MLLKNFLDTGKICISTELLKLCILMEKKEAEKISQWTELRAL